MPKCAPRPREPSRREQRTLSRQQSAAYLARITSARPLADKSSQLNVHRDTQVTTHSTPTKLLPSSTKRSTGRRRDKPIIIPVSPSPASRSRRAKASLRRRACKESSPPASPISRRSSSSSLRQYHTARTGGDEIQHLLQAFQTRVARTAVEIGDKADKLAVSRVNAGSNSSVRKKLRSSLPRAPPSPQRTPKLAAASPRKRSRPLNVRPAVSEDLFSPARVTATSKAKENVPTATEVPKSPGLRLRKSSKENIRLKPREVPLVVGGRRHVIAKRKPRNPSVTPTALASSPSKSQQEQAVAIKDRPSGTLTSAPPLTPKQKQHVAQKNVLAPKQHSVTARTSLASTRSLETALAPATRPPSRQSEHSQVILHPRPLEALVITPDGSAPTKQSTPNSKKLRPIIRPVQRSPKSTTESPRIVPIRPKPLTSSNKSSPSPLKPKPLSTALHAERTLSSRRSTSAVPRPPWPTETSAPLVRSGIAATDVAASEALPLPRDKSNLALSTSDVRPVSAVPVPQENIPIEPCSTIADPLPEAIPSAKASTHNSCGPLTSRVLPGAFPTPPPSPARSPTTHAVPSAFSWSLFARASNKDAVDTGRTTGSETAPKKGGLRAIEKMVKAVWRPPWRG